MTRTVRAATVAISIGLVLATPFPSTAQQNEEERAKSERVSDLLEILGDRDGRNLKGGNAQPIYAPTH